MLWCWHTYGSQVVGDPCGNPRSERERTAQQRRSLGSWKARNCLKRMEINAENTAKRSEYPQSSWGSLLSLPHPCWWPHLSAAMDYKSWGIHLCCKKTLHSRSRHFWRGRLSLTRNALKQCSGLLGSGTGERDRGVARCGHVERSWSSNNTVVNKEQTYIGSMMVYPVDEWWFSCRPCSRII